ncbi:uncharacterized protein MONOS_7540 [Monocercomonoides exilis]|uniref:uncharacterized protein n=1 Tax=Monocercomonoides exilis TaxID=2049356 RepID=UPI00355A3EFD|nr:hypothetical protein MONOS_7540 [Monocercomonoides exilis]|eukprot:MONOS_7540.1-p1 / transcript=MONOS_7540.1 / gene=MONOS_7540 / organism=Monocercomonoides_exilis_PA203 / gene_product=unspecified product / transcript_product=unspecified product / location=Mono_scaffold00260:11975-12220(+) / protein_length=82 / sequence_SO=supercontig / SO=protein_coding / is_pseudo=false
MAVEEMGKREEVANGFHPVREALGDKDDGSGDIVIQIVNEPKVEMREIACCEHCLPSGDEPSSSGMVESFDGTIEKEEYSK